MKRIKDKDTEILESELTIVGFIFFMMWLILNIYLGNVQNKNLNKQLIEAKAIAVEYYESDKLMREMIISLNEEIDRNYEEINQYKHLEKLLKDSL